MEEENCLEELYNEEFEGPNTFLVLKVLKTSKNLMFRALLVKKSLT